MGDGILATFTGPAQAVRCAQTIIGAERDRGLEVRIGVHTGEVEIFRDDVAGLGVHLAARIMDRGGSRRDPRLADGSRSGVGSELEFADHGEHALKGLPEPWQLYACI